jgi:CHAD domain-containing protein
MAEKGGIGVQTKSISGAAAVELPANIQDLVMALAGRRRDFEAAQAALDTAESNLRAANQKTADIRNRIATQERALAESNAPLPESQSADEVRLALAEKHARILALRRDAAREPCEKISPEIKRLKSEIDAAWIEFGRQGFGARENLPTPAFQK